MMEMKPEQRGCIFKLGTSFFRCLLLLILQLLQADRRNSLGQLSAAYFDYLEPAQHTGELSQQFNSI